MANLGYLRNLEGASQNNVRIGNLLQQANAQTKQLVPVSGQDTRKILSKGLFEFVQPVQQNPVPLLPSGLATRMTNTALSEWLARSQAGTLYYDDLIQADPEDNLYWVRFKQMIKTNNPVFKQENSQFTKVGLAFIPPGFWNYVERKMNMMEEAAFKFWAFSNIDNTNPAERQWWMERIPEFIPALEKGKKKTMQILNMLGDIRIRGVQSEEDLRKLWIISIGGYEFPETTVEMPVSARLEANQFSGNALEGGDGRPFPETDRKSVV